MESIIIIKGVYNMFEFKVLDIKEMNKGRRIYKKRFNADHIDSAIQRYGYYLRDQLGMYENNINELTVTIECNYIDTPYKFEKVITIKRNGYVYDVVEVA
jgi:uncharacterized protein YhbP (UPF0306 family)